MWPWTDWKLRRALRRYRRERDGVPEDGFVHIDIPLTLEHQLELMGNAGFRKAKVLYQNGGTMVIRAEK